MVELASAVAVAELLQAVVLLAALAVVMPPKALVVALRSDQR